MTQYLVECGTVESSKVVRDKLYVEVTGEPSFSFSIPLDGLKLGFRGPAAGEKIYFVWGVGKK